MAKKYTHFNNSGSNHKIFDAESAYVTGTLQVGPAIPTLGSDVNFFVSGNIGGKDGATPGVGVFGGDLVVSGAIWALSGVQGVNSYWASETAGEIFTSASLVNVPSGSVHAQFLSSSNGAEISGSVLVDLSQGPNFSFVISGSGNGLPAFDVVSPGNIPGEEHSMFVVDPTNNRVRALSLDPSNYINMELGTPALQVISGSHQIDLNPNFDRIAFFVSASAATGSISVIDDNSNIGELQLEATTLNLYINGLAISGDAGVAGYALTSSGPGVAPGWAPFPTPPAAVNYFYSETNNIIEASGSLYVSGAFRALSLSASNGGEITGSFRQGLNVVASGTGSHAEGYFTTGSGNYSHAEGGYTTGSGDWAHAEGLFARAAGNFSHAEGIRTEANGEASHAEGSGSFAIGIGSHAEGQNTQANGMFSHAEGSLTVTYGNYSHAEGLQTIARNVGDHAAGRETEALGGWSYAAGYGTIASGSYQHVIGKYNKRGDNTSLFVVGNGTGDLDVNRSDIFKVKTNEVDVTGKFVVTGNAVFTQGMTGSIPWVDEAGTLPFLVAGPNATVNFLSTGQWAITGAAESQPEWYYTANTGEIATSGSAAITGSLAVTGAAYFSPAGTGRGLLNFGGLDIGPITGSITIVSGTQTSYLGVDILSASNGAGPNAVVEHEMHVLAVGALTNSSGIIEHFFSATYLVTSKIDNVGIQSLIGSVELTRESSGSFVNQWDVNVESDMKVALTGTMNNGGLNEVRWFVERTRERSKKW